MKTKLLTLLFAFLTVLASAVDSPFLIPFQARLTNQQGVAYTSGQYTITFNLYDSAVGGATAWTERHELVGVVNGTVNVFLGSINPALASVDFSTTRYLGITIDADNNANTPDPEMVPRQMIIPAFFAKQASTARTMNVLDGSGLPVPGQAYGWAALFSNGNPATGSIAGARLTVGSIAGDKLADGTVGTAKLSGGAITTDQILDQTIATADLADGAVTNAKITNATISASKLDVSTSQSLIPTGTILPFAGTIAPAGFFLCDGSAVSRATYAGLFLVINTNFGAPDVTSFNVPDLRGQFLRGMMPILQANCTGSAAGNSVTTTATHPFNRTGMRVKVSGTLTTGLVAGTTYYIIRVNPTSLAFAATQADAIGNTRITISGAAGGMLVNQDEDPDAGQRLAGAIGGATGNAVGSVQADELKSHQHSLIIGGAFAFNGTGNLAVPTQINSLSGATGGNETRPKNAYVNYIIKF